MILRCRSGVDCSACGVAEGSDRSDRSGACGVAEGSDRSGSACGVAEGSDRSGCGVAEGSACGVAEGSGSDCSGCGSAIDRSACGVAEGSDTSGACGVAEDSACGVAEDSACGVAEGSGSEGSACGVAEGSDRSGCGVAEGSACGVAEGSGSDRSACGVAEDSACGVADSGSSMISKLLADGSDFLGESERSSPPIVEFIAVLAPPTSLSGGWMEGIDTTDNVSDTLHIISLLNLCHINIDINMDTYLRLKHVYNRELQRGGSYNVNEDFTGAYKVFVKECIGHLKEKDASKNGCKEFVNKLINFTVNVCILVHRNVIIMGMDTQTDACKTEFTSPSPIEGFNIIHQLRHRLKALRDIKSLVVPLQNTFKEKPNSETIIKKALKVYCDQSIRSLENLRDSFSYQDKKSNNFSFPCAVAKALAASSIYSDACDMIQYIQIEGNPVFSEIDKIPQVCTEITAEEKSPDEKELKA